MKTYDLCKLLLLPAAVSLAACGNDTMTSASGGGSSGGIQTTGATTSTSGTPTTSASASATDGSASATEGMTSSAPTTTATTGSMTSGTTSGPGTTTGMGTTAVEGTTTGMGTTGGTTMGVEPGSTGTTGGGSTGMMSGGSSTGGPPPLCQPGDGMGMGMVDKSYIWINNQDSGTIAKVNTQTLIEEARYRTGPSGGTESPSRTAVSADGRFVVANGRGTGRSTMFASDKAACVDKNGNGMIDTSTGPNDIKAWGADECQLWTIVHPFAGGFSTGPRGVTWTAGTWDYDLCKYVEPKVWLGYLAAGGIAHIVRIDGLTGVVEVTLPVPAFVGSGYAPYGGALDPQFRPWFTGLRGEAIRVNTDQNPITVSRFPAPGNVQAYGMTVDSDGNVWTGGCSGPVSMFDPVANQWISIAGTSACHRGIGAGDQYVWVASNSPCGLVQIDRKSRTLVTKHTPPGCSVAIGISIDVENYLWLVDQSGFAWKINQDNVQWDKKVTVPGSHYVYSDMTGGQLLSVLPQ